MKEVINRPVGVYEQTKEWMKARDKIVNSRAVTFTDPTDIILGAKPQPEDEEVKSEHSADYYADLGKEETEVKIVSKGELGLQGPHHLLKSIVNFNTDLLLKDVKDSCFGQEYDIVTKGEAFKVLRQTRGAEKKLDSMSRRQRYEREFNGKCRMVQSKHIEQMAADAEPPKN